jgi:hypothetical protein
MTVVGGIGMDEAITVNEDKRLRDKHGGAVRVACGLTGVSLDEQGVRELIGALEATLRAARATPRHDRYGRSS